MQLDILKDKRLWWYMAKLLVAYAVVYGAYMVIWGLSAPRGYYSPFVAQYLDFRDSLRFIILSGSKLMLLVFGYPSELIGETTLKTAAGGSVIMDYPCIGVAIMVAWVAFVAAGAGSFLKKLCWTVSGIIVIISINVLRISALLLAVNNRVNLPFGIDTHDTFNMAAYLGIVIMMYAYYVREKNNMMLG